MRNNAAQSALLGVVASRVDNAEDMALFDALPPAVRRELINFPINIVVERVAHFCRSYPTSVIVDQLRAEADKIRQQMRAEQVRIMTGPSLLSHVSTVSNLNLNRGSDGRAAPDCGAHAVH